VNVSMKGACSHASGNGGRRNVGLLTLQESRTTMRGKSVPIAGMGGCAAGKAPATFMMPSVDEDGTREATGLRSTTLLVTLWVGRTDSTGRADPSVDSLTPGIAGTDEVGVDALRGGRSGHDEVEDIVVSRVTGT
jgi:hypothetical protein